MEAVILKGTYNLEKSQSDEFNMFLNILIDFKKKQLNITVVKIDENSLSKVCNYKFKIKTKDLVIINIFNQDVERANYCQDYINFVFHYIIYNYLGCKLTFDKINNPFKI